MPHRYLAPVLLKLPVVKSQFFVKTITTNDVKVLGVWLQHTA